VVGVTDHDFKPGEVYMGSPAFDANKYRKAYIHFRNLDNLVQRVNIIEKQQKEIKEG
jgi:UDP-3-O-[3-hydroxymyristoyl] glucosamine N-acyltransferase